MIHMMVTNAKRMWEEFFRSERCGSNDFIFSVVPVTEGHIDQDLFVNIGLDINAQT
jgi:hypothetical protein